MAQSGKIQAITGLVTARTQEGTVRELHVGDVVFENEIIATATGASISIVQEDGNILALTGDDQILLDESVNGSIAPSDAVVQDVADLQEAILQALENNRDIDEVLEETAAGELDDTYDFRSDYHEGDTTKEMSAHIYSILKITRQNICMSSFLLTTLTMKMTTIQTIQIKLPRRSH